MPGGGRLGPELVLGWLRWGLLSGAYESPFEFLVDPEPKPEDLRVFFDSSCPWRYGERFTMDIGDEERWQRATPRISVDVLLCFGLSRSGGYSVTLTLTLQIQKARARLVLRVGA